MRPLQLAIGLVSVVLAVLAASSALAQAPQPKGGSPEYREAIRKALAEYELGNYPEAKLFFSDAHALYPNARTLRGLALTAYALRDYVAAVEYFEQALANQVQPLSSQLRSGVTEFLEQARRFVAHVELNVEPRTAELRIDERPLTRAADGTVMLNPGQHELVATAPDHETVVRRWNVEAGARSRLDIVLPRSPPVTAAPPPVAATPAPAQADPVVAQPAPIDGPDYAPEEVSRETLGPWIVVGVSGALAIAGGVLLGVTVADLGKVEDARKGTEWSTVEPAYDRTPGLSAAGFTMLGLGLVGVGVGLAWQFWPQDERAVSLRVSPTGASLQGRF